MKTFTAKNETVQRDWYVVDASGKTLGRLCSELARRLRGKHKPVYTPHVDTGDYLVVINAEKIAVTGNKLQDKMYHRFTGYVGNLKSETLGQALERHPERVIEIGVKGMLPKNPLGRAMYRKLKVYKGSEHPHTAVGFGNRNPTHRCGPEAALIQRPTDLRPVVDQPRPQLRRGQPVHPRGTAVAFDALQCPHDVGL